MALDFARLKTLPGLLRYHAETRPDAIALKFESRETTYAAFDRAADGIAGWLKQAGIGPSGRIAYLGKNSDRYFQLLFGAARAGLVTVPLNWRLKDAEWAFILEDAAATHLFVDRDFTAQAQSLPALAPLLSRIIPIEDETSWRDITGVANGGAEDANVSPDQVVVQIYTSGTTGMPKGAMLSHGNVLALREPGLRAGLDWFPQPPDTSVLVMPVAHIAGTAYGLFGLHSGGCLAIAREFDAAATLDLLRSSGATHMLLAPAALRMLVEHPHAQTTHLPDFRYLTYGGSPITSTLLEKSLALLHCGFTQMYGMTEVSGGVTALTPDDHRTGNPELLLSAGRPMLGAEISVVDREGNHLAAREIGEVVVRSGAVMKGYWQRSEATAETIDSDGWLRTGDIGYLDEDGYLFIRDRAKDTIITGGENVYPAEVENALAKHPDIADIAIIGVPSEKWGEEVKAVIVPRPGTSISTDAIIAWARQRIAAYKVPKTIDIVDELPRNVAGKILRRLLREPYWTGHDRQVG